MRDDQSVNRDSNARPTGHATRTCQIHDPQLQKRLTYMNPDTLDRTDQQQEYTIVANWFFNGHHNKLTAYHSLLDFIFVEGTTGAKENRVRQQWELSPLVSRWQYALSFY